MINYWMDREQTPNLLESHRLMGAMFDLGICQQNQLAVALGWPITKVRWTIDDVRRKAKRNKENPDAWIKFWQHGSDKSANVYTLGKKGIALVCDLLEQDVGKRKPLKGNVAHFLGTNDILVRLIESGNRPDLWYSQKEVASYLFHKLGEKEFIYDLDQIAEVKYKRPKVPLDPDGLIENHVGRFYIEYDTGTQVSHVIESKFDRYFQMKPRLNEEFGVIFVTRKPGRIQTIREAFKTVYNEIYQGRIDPYPAYVFREGTETDFLSGKVKTDPICVAESLLEPSGSAPVELPGEPIRDDGEIERLQKEVSELKKRVQHLEARLNEKLSLEKDLQKWHEGLKGVAGGFFGKGLENYLKENPFPLKKH